jgi:hypothetical protein
MNSRPGRYRVKVAALDIETCNFQASLSKTANKLEKR